MGEGGGIGPVDRFQRRQPGPRRADRGHLQVRRRPGHLPRGDRHLLRPVRDLPAPAAGHLDPRLPAAGRPGAPAAGARLGPEPVPGPRRPVPPARGPHGLDDGGDRRRPGRDVRRDGPRHRGAERHEHRLVRAAQQPPQPDPAARPGPVDRRVRRPGGARPDHAVRADQQHHADHLVRGVAAALARPRGERAGHRRPAVGADAPGGGAAGAAAHHAARGHVHRGDVAPAPAGGCDLRDARARGCERRQRDVRGGARPDGRDLPGVGGRDARRRAQRRPRPSPVAARPAHPVHRLGPAHRGRPPCLQRVRRGPAPQGLRDRHRRLRRRPGASGSRSRGGRRRACPPRRSSPGPAPRSPPRWRGRRRSRARR